MESLLNCVWLSLGLLLIAIWSAHAFAKRSRSHRELLPARCVQFAALLVLVILLFPVISLTDDITRCTAPQETERALRLHDPLDGSAPASALLPAATAWTNVIAAAFREAPHQSVEQTAELTTLLEATRLPVDSRPPPAAL